MKPTSEDAKITAGNAPRRDSAEAAALTVGSPSSSSSSQTAPLGMPPKRTSLSLATRVGIATLAVVSVLFIGASAFALTNGFGLPADSPVVKAAESVGIVRSVDVEASSADGADEAKAGKGEDSNEADAANKESEDKKDASSDTSGSDESKSKGDGSSSDNSDSSGSSDSGSGSSSSSSAGSGSSSSSSGCLFELVGLFKLEFFGGWLFATGHFRTCRHGNRVCFRIELCGGQPRFGRRNFHVQPRRDGLRCPVRVRPFDERIEHGLRHIRKCHWRPCRKRARRTQRLDVLSERRRSHDGVQQLCALQRRFRFLVLRDGLV